jgi:hypothetical protein
VLKKCMLHNFCNCQFLHISCIFPLRSMQSGILKRIEEKENERDSFELQISNVNLSHIDEREKNMVR